ncbi:MAG: 2-dehydro-3-deoxygalactonokinase [Bacteroidota bacterium]
MHTTFLSCDWGTSSFRLRLIDITSEKTLAESSSNEGIAHVYAEWKNTGKDENERVHFYLSILENHISKIEESTATGVGNIPVIISGMASATIGIMELSYSIFPFLLTGENLKFKKIDKTHSFAHDLVIVSGARTDHDVMRGEETQLLGCTSIDTPGKQIFIFTGTHSKHITTIDGSATAIQTYMTGEFFELLARKSILSDSVTAGGSIEDKENKLAFEQGVQDSLRQNLLHHSFMVRTNQLFKRFSKTENYFYLSGLLIGAELSQVSTKDADAITIVGDNKIVVNYLLALEVLNIKTSVSTVDAAIATIRGQTAIYRNLYESTNK